jgi:energy-coupling factor transporter ATP-binding protein EcfA2
VLALRSVTYRYPGYRAAAIHEVDLSIADGEVVGLVGQNEAGKSTVCLVASGLAPASIGGELRGDVVLDGVATRSLRPVDLAGRAGIVFANPRSQLSGIAATVFEEVAFGPVNLGLPVPDTVARTKEALAALGIEDLGTRRPGNLSGGQTQLVAIASMLAMRPRTLVLDEPVSELDPEGRRLVGEALRSFAGAGTSLLVAEHDLDLLHELGARIVTIARGRIGAAP